MDIEERIAALEEENQKLKADNERLLNIIDQMNITLNRLINRCISEKSKI